MITFEDRDRFNFPLTQDSVVIDVGAYRGQWAKHISELYHCAILAFEPCKRWFDEASQALVGHPNVKLFHCGLAGSFREVEFGVQNDSTGEFAGSPERETVRLLPIFPFIIEQCGRAEFDLLKLNCENGEYDILEKVLELKQAHSFKAMIVQFHINAPDYEKRYEAIAAGLSATHELVSRIPFVWEKWERR